MKRYFSKNLSTVKQFMFDLYRNCKLRSKKDHRLPPTNKDSYILTPDEQLIHFMLENSSQTAEDDQRSLYMTNRAIWNICYKLCPGKWCDRSHCKSYSGRCAYHCGTGRKPSSCKEYKAYVERKAQRELVRDLTGKTTGENE